MQFFRTIQSLVISISMSCVTIRGRRSVNIGQASIYRHNSSSTAINFLSSVTIHPVVSVWQMWRALQLWNKVLVIVEQQQATSLKHCSLKQTPAGAPFISALSCLRLLWSAFLLLLLPRCRLQWPILRVSYIQHPLDLSKRQRVICRNILRICLDAEHMIALLTAVLSGRWGCSRMWWQGRLVCHC